MAHISRLFDFQAGTKIISSQVDAEYDQIIAFVNELDDFRSITLPGEEGASKIGESGGGTLQALLDMLVRFTTANIKYIRLNSDKVIETSTDGVVWEASGSSGHIIIDSVGTVLPQRSRLRINNSTVVDDPVGNQTIIQGLQGPTGPPGPTGPTGPTGPGAGPVTAADVGVSNRNLLHNWYFPLPVNQRGQSSYTGGINGVYGIDRWKILRGTYDVATRTFVADGVFADGGFYQWMENPQSYAGLTLTFSAKFSNADPAWIGVFADSVLVGIEYKAAGASAIVSKTITMPLSITSNLYVVVGSAGMTNTIVLDYAKLEVGPVSTLANDPPPNFGEQLALCQRYCQTMRYSLARATINVANSLSFRMGLPVPFRITPSIESGEFRVVLLDSAPQTDFTFNVGDAAGSTVQINAVKTSHGLTDAVLRAHTLVVLSADL